MVAAAGKGPLVAAAAAAAAATVGALAYVLVRSSRAPQSPGANGASPKASTLGGGLLGGAGKARSPLEEALANKEPTPVPAGMDLVQVLEFSQTRCAKVDHRDYDPASPVYEAVQAIDAATTPSATLRLAAARWLASCHMAMQNKVTTSEASPEDKQAAMAAALPLLDKAWALLQMCLPDNRDNWSLRDRLRLEITMRRGDVLEMTQTYEPVARERDKSGQDLYMLLVSAAHIGRVADLIKWGKTMKERQLAIFDELPSQPFNYALVYRSAERLQAANPRDLALFEFPYPESQAFAVARYNIKFESMQCKDKRAITRRMREVPKDFVMAMDASPVPINKVGSTVRWMSPSDTPMSGLMSQTVLSLTGSGLAKPDNKVVLRVEETIDLRRSDPNNPLVWTGTHTWTQTKETGHVPANMIFTIVSEVKTFLLPLNADGSHMSLPDYKELDEAESKRRAALMPKKKKRKRSKKKKQAQDADDDFEGDEEKEEDLAGAEQPTAVVDPDDVD